MPSHKFSPITRLQLKQVLIDQPGISGTTASPLENSGYWFLLTTFTPHSKFKLMGFGFFEILLILLVILLLFGARKIPELMRGIGRGAKEFKEGKDGRRKEKE